MLETVLFYMLSFLAVLFALGVIASRSAIYSVLSLVAALCSIAGLFVLLKAFFVATVLVLVYAGAILVLFLFVVMLIDYKKVQFAWQGFRISRLFAVILGVLILVQITQVIKTIEAPQANVVHGTTEKIGSILFNNYVLPFELTAFLLLAAIVGIVVLAKRDV